MTESNSFSSLSALAASHLSKTCVQDTNQDSGLGLGQRRIPIPSLNGVRAGSASDTCLAPGRLPSLPLPPCSLSESPLKSVLEEQISNMLKAQDRKRKQEEDARLIKEMKELQLKEEDCMIDLTAALQDAELFRKQHESCPPKEEVLSNSSSFESLFEPKFIDCDADSKTIQTPEQLLPCCTDMSYILKQKVKSAKCSAFGRVLTSRLRPVAVPYLREKAKHNIVPFDFKTNNPLDALKMKPTMSARCTFDITTFLL